jgi:hypothetical protein
MPLNDLIQTPGRKKMSVFRKSRNKGKMQGTSLKNALSFLCAGRKANASKLEFS